MIIVPAILELTTAKLREQILRVDRELPEMQYVHIDIMDGIFVPGMNDIDVSYVESMSTRLKFELHLMVSDPTPFMKAWSGTNIKRVIIHQELIGDMNEIIKEARKLNYEVGIAVKPPTEYLETSHRPDVVMFMTVNPGRQGAPFETSVLEKIKKFTSNPNHPTCACDGAVNPETAPLLKAAGVEIFNVGSFFSKAPNLHTAYEILKKTLA